MSAKDGIRTALQAFRSMLTSLSVDTSADNTPGICYILNLPPEILQTITEYLKFVILFH
jgi:hypothetical protein